jgi:hypothetical protein
MKELREWGEVGSVVLLLAWIFGVPEWSLPVPVFVLLIIIHASLVIRYIYLFINRHRRK